MILPDDPFELVVPQTPDFRFTGWEYAFGKYNFFYLVGSRKLMARARIFNLSTVTQHSADRQPVEEWARQYPAFHWEEALGSNQVERALKHKPQLFAKTCLSLLTVVQAVIKHGNPDFIEAHRNTRVSEFLKIKPAVFGIPAYGESAYRRLSAQEKEAVLAACRQKREPLLYQVAVDRGATYPTVRDMCPALAGTAPFAGAHHTPRVELITERYTLARQVSLDEAVDEAV